MRLHKVIKIAIIVLLIFIFGFLIRTDYFIIMPSKAVNLRQIISVENSDQDDKGSFFLVTVSQTRAGLLTAIYGYLHPHIEVITVEDVIPSGMGEEEYRELLRENMIESQQMAQVVALRRAGYTVEITSDGVEILELLPDGPATGYLREGDIIFAVDGQPVILSTEVPLYVQDRAVGEVVTLRILRAERELELIVPTRAHPENPELPYLGIIIRTLNWSPVIPVSVIMDTGRIAGQSAGLMFVLEILDQLAPEDLTAGKLIAGTGTIDLNENVGIIGGTRQKVIAAERTGAEYFIVPRDNYEEAKTAARRIKLIPVSNLDEALTFLLSLQN